MTIFGTIYDNTTKEGIPGASISVADSQGNPLSQGVSADNTGWFQLISPLLDQGNKVWISSIGYQTALVDPNVFISSMGLGLDPGAAQSLSPVVVTPGQNKTNLAPYLIGGGVLALMLLSSGKKKKMSGMGAIGKETTTLLVGGGIILVGGYFLIKKVLPGLNPFPSATDPVDKAATATAQATALAQAQASGKATYTADQYIGWANDIFKLGTLKTPLDIGTMNAITQDVTNVNNMVDLQSLISAFGTKGSGGTMCNLFNMYCDTYDLNSFLKAVLDSDHINTINEFLFNQGINYTF